LIGYGEPSYENTTEGSIFKKKEEIRGENGTVRRYRLLMPKQRDL